MLFECSELDRNYALQLQLVTYDVSVRHVSLATWLGV